MAKETLDSDRVNYLIWRYLAESGYKETAVRLQKEWNVEDPQRLEFAPHVTNHALVGILNRGLLYNIIEREDGRETETETDHVEQPVQVATAATVPGFFGPVMPQSPPADEDLENARKRQHDSEPRPVSSGPPVKKARLSNGYENGFEPTPMDVDDDQNGDEHAYPSPEQAPTPVAVTAGPEQGTQVDKVDELSTETTFLDLSDDPGRNSNTVLLQCEFNPRDATILAAAGTDALARMWILSRATSAPTAPAPDTAADSESPSRSSFAPHHNLLDDNAPLSTTTTGLSWASDGSSVAVSSEPMDDGLAKVAFWTTDGRQFAAYNHFESPIILLRWNLDNTACLALSPENEGRGTLLSVMYPVADRCISYSLPAHSLMEQSLDAAWVGNNEFVLCGGDILEAMQCTDSAIKPERKYETREGHALSKITYDWRSQLLATASDTGMIDIWDHSGQCRSFNAHQGLITALAWQPMQSPLALGDDMERLLASAGEDGAISIWNARSSETKSKSSMTMVSAVVALSFTPDGAFLAGGTTNQILIWKVDDVSLPRATWLRGDEAGWRTPQSHDSSTEEDQFSLSWDANGQKLAYGVNSRLAVINFGR